MNRLLSGLRLLACTSAVIAALAAVPVAAGVDAPVESPDPFAAAVLRRLEKLPQYLELTSLYEKQLRQDETAQGSSSRSRRLQALVKRLRAQAASTTTIDPENPQGLHVANFTSSSGRIVRLTSVVPSQVEANPAVRNDVAGMVARFIMDEAVSDGLIPFDPPPDRLESAAKEMKRGYGAARQKEYAAAILHFEQARALTPAAPEIYYNLGLAESRIPGRELRAVVWFGAYLAIDPGAPNAPAVRRQIADLETGGITRFIRITAEIADEISDENLRQLYLIQLVDLWARIGDFSAAAEALEKIHGAYNKDSALLKMVEARARQGDFREALRLAAMIRTPSVNGAALRSVAQAQADAGDMESAMRTVSSIGDHFSRSTGYQWLAMTALRNGDSAAARNMLETGLKSSAGIVEAYFRDLARQYIATSQAQAGDFAAAFKTIASIADPFQASLARLYTAEWQAYAGDVAGARQTLAAGLRSIDSVKEDSRPIALGAYREVKGRIDAGIPGRRDEQPATARTPSVTPTSWIMKNEGLLNAPVFRDLNGYLKTLPADSPGKIFEALKETASTLIAAHDEIVAMVDELDRRNPQLLATSEQVGSAGGERAVDDSAEVVEAAVTAKASAAREYSYQGRQIALAPEQLFDITGRVVRAEVTMSDLGAGPEFGVSLVLMDSAQQVFKEFAGRNTGQEAGLLYQSRLVLVAVMRDISPSGIIPISGGFRTIQEAQKLAEEFKAR